MSSERVPVAAPIIGDREIEYVTQAVRSGWVSSIGPFIDRFEQDFARFAGVRHAIAVSNGTVALHLALHALGIGPGDEVVIPDLTFAATAHAVIQAGAVPVLVDVDPVTWCLDPAALARALGPRTRAVMPVHLYGHPADMDRIGALAREAGAPVLEDAAEAHGAEWNGGRVGSLGRVAAFSFYGNKILTTGEGGALTTDDEALATRIRFLKDHGMSKERRYFHTELAFNYRMTNLQAALGVAQLEQVDAFIEKKREIFRWYQAGLADVPGLTLNPEAPGARSVFWMTCAILPDGSDREAVGRRLGEAGIDWRPFFAPLHEMPHLAGFRRVGAFGADCPVSRQLSRQGLNLPSGCGLTRPTVERVCQALRAALP